MAPKKSNLQQKSLHSFFKRSRTNEDEGSNSGCSGAVDVPSPAPSVPVTEEPHHDSATASSSSSRASSSSTATAIHPINDISLFLGAITPYEKFKILEEAWQPDIRFMFPVSTYRNLKFQLSWLRDFEWLRYSAIEDGAYCLWCSLFSRNAACGKGGHERAGQLVNEKFCRWKSALEYFRNHEKTEMHLNARVSAAQFIAVYSGKESSIVEALDSALKQEVEENRRRIAPIIETVLFCGKNGLPLRGHTESGDILSIQPEARDGNFRALLRFRLQSGDDDLANHLEKAAANAKYTSPQVQNEIIECCNNIITRQLVDEINRSKGFSILADETADSGKIEQMVICIRYLKESVLQEAFLTFVPVTSMTGEALANTIIKALQELGIDTAYMFGQGYDGAAAMSSRFKGVQSYLRALNPLALYVHCSSHSFNLAVSDACGIPVVTNCMAVLSSAYDFFRHPKRNNLLEQSVEAVKPQATHKRLKKLCSTRWVERHESVLTFIELTGPVLHALEKIISSWTDKDTVSNANTLQKSILDGGFLLTLHVVAEVFAISLPLSQQLQKKEMDLAAAMDLADSAQQSIQSMRDACEENFHRIFSSVSMLARGFEVELEIPRRCARLLYRCNVEANSPEEYYRRAVYLPFLDSFLTQMQERLLRHRNILSCFSSLLPDKAKCSKGVTDEVSKQISILHTTYYEHLDCSELEFQGDIKQYYQHLSKLETTPTNALDALALQVCARSTFPKVRRMLEVLAILPVTTATPERCFSTLKYLKNYLRSTCGQIRLNGLALLYIHYNLPCTVEQVMDELHRTGCCKRLKLALKI